MRCVCLPHHASLASAIAAALMAAAPIIGSSAARASSAYVVAQAEKPTGQGRLNGIDAAKRKLNITHGPIATLKWPGMTLDFGVAPGVDLRALKPGQKISFTLSRGADEVYVIDEIKPAQ
jgi:Cu(I)/Ag(I) efflux system periplasmic protein CusF